MGWIPYRLESYYEEYVKRTWYTDKSLYDKTGRRVQYSQNSKHVLKVLKVKNSHTQGVTKRCRLSWLTNSALVYEPKCGGRGGGVAGSQPISTAVHRSPNKLWRSNSIFNLWSQMNGDE